MPFDLPIEVQPLPYESRLLERRVEDVDLVVIHCTELPDLAMARSYGERVLYDDRGTGASGHYYVDRDGRVLQWVDPLRVANHTRGYNPRSIGIELVNLGRWPDWLHSERQRMSEPYPQAQVDALLQLLAALRARFPRLDQVAGHEDLDRAMVPASDDPTREVPRKRDPGEMFPWQRVLAASGLQRLLPGP
jgi:N-acetylmuramoyl-L-alanine amidase